MARFFSGETGVIIKITIGNQHFEEKVDDEESCMVGFEKAPNPVKFIISLAESGAKISSSALSLRPESVSYSGIIIAKTTRLGERHTTLPDELEFPAHLIEVIEANSDDPHTKSFSEFLNFSDHCRFIAESIKAGRQTVDWGREQIEMFRERRLLLSRHLANSK